MTELEAYIQLGFGASIKGLDGIDWTYQSIAASRGVETLTFGMFCDWLESRRGEPVQMAITWGYDSCKSE